MRLRIGRPSPTLAIACLALFVALGGTGYALTTISGSQLVNRSVGGVKIKRDTLGKPEIKEAGIASAATPMDSRPGPLPLQASFTTHGGPIVIAASGSAYRTGTPGVVGVEVLVDGLSRGVARVYTNETLSHKAFVAAGIPVTGLRRGKHTLSLAPLANISSDASDFYTVTVFEQATAVGADRLEPDNVQGARHYGACRSDFARHSAGATLAPARDDDWWATEWSFGSPDGGDIELKLVGNVTMDVFVHETTTRLARNVKRFRKPSAGEYYDVRVHGTKPGSYVLTCQLIPSSALGASASSLVRSGR